MIEFVQLIVKFYNAIFKVFELYPINVGGISVSPLEILIGFLVLSIITSVVWKGAKG